MKKREKSSIIRERLKLSNDHHQQYIHCVKSIQVWNFFWSVFSCIQSEYRKIPTRSSAFGHFSRSDSLNYHHYFLRKFLNWLSLVNPFPVSVPIWKYQKTFGFLVFSGGYFQGVKNGNIGQKWLNIQRSNETPDLLRLFFVRNTICDEILQFYSTNNLNEFFQNNSRNRRGCWPIYDVNKWNLMTCFVAQN